MGRNPDRPDPSRGVAGSRPSRNSASGLTFFPQSRPSRSCRACGASSRPLRPFAERVTYKRHMADHTTVRFTEQDLALLDAIQRKTGIVSRTEILRRAIRALAEKEGVDERAPARRRKK